MKRLKKWVNSNKIVHHISKHLNYEVTETKIILFWVVIKRKLITLMSSHISHNSII